MTKWKLISSKDYGMLKQGVVYDENYASSRFYMTVGECASRHPHDWQKVEEEFVLPEKWCVRGGDEMMLWQIEKMDGDCDKFFCNETSFYTLHNKSDMSAWDYMSSKPNCYTEITYDQFIKYVYEPWKNKQEIEDKRNALIEQVKKYSSFEGMKPYPKRMLVWNNEDFKVERYVLCKDEGFYITYAMIDETIKTQIARWVNAEDIEEPVMYRCPYNNAVKCLMNDCCNGCENWKPELF
jgi:hypothetical protein